MKKHLKFVLFLAAIALIAVLISDMRKGRRSTDPPALRKIKTGEFVIALHYPSEGEELQIVRVRLLDIFLGVLGLAFVGITSGYVVSLVKGGGKQKAGTVEPEVPGGEPPAEEGPRRKLSLEKALGRTGAKILSALMVTILILVVLAVLVMVVFLLFPEKFPLLQELFGAARL